MNLKYGRQIDFEELNGYNFELFLFANNIEKRKLTAFNSIIQNNNVEKAIAFNYNESLDEKIEIPLVENQTVSSIIQIRNIIRDVIINSSKTEINLFIDYSCMTKPWYYSILSYLAESEIENKVINAYFSYTASIYSEPLEPKPNTRIEPIEGSYKIPTSTKPKALIVCLGYEQNKAQGIIDQLEPKLTYICYSNPALDSKFVSAIQNNNKDILRDIGSEYTFTFPFDDIKFLEKQLTSLYYNLRDEYSIIIAPLGPKPFTFVAMVLSIIFKEIEVWRVDSGLDLNRYTREPFNPASFIVNKIVFSS
ncbi:hypothetical protein [Chryseobacterium sp. JV274]|jgi:hypothetical protein|uniref:hypothetical protein n=1 Tax=Chryseobacterium sp. JV274 TaxID=1932669 RepID=UPI0009840D87|nr:hypothetical protein [Chryseobacterium sp. JV274]